MATSQRCPECQALLKFANPVAPGKKVRCNKCQTVFTVSGGSVPESAAIQDRSRSRAAGNGNGDAGARSRDRRPPRDGDDEAYDDRPRKRPARDDYDGEDDDRPRRRKAKSGGKGLLIGLIAGGAVLLIGGIIGTIFLFKGGSPREAAWLVGEWEGIEGPEKGNKIEFTKDNKFIAPGFGGKRTVGYRLVSATKLEIDVPAEERKLLEALTKGVGKEISIPSAMTVTVEITESTLVVHPPTEPPFAQPGMKQNPSRYRKLGSPTGGDGGERNITLENSLKQIGLAYHNHCDSKRKAPAKAEDLMPFMENDQKLLNLLKTDVVFIYNVAPLDMLDGTSNTILAYEREAPKKGGYVLFGDSMVQRLSAAEFAARPLARPRGKDNDPPKDNPDPGAGIVGNWQGTGRGKDRNIQFTQDGKFLESGPEAWNQPRTYRFAGSTLELDISPAEKANLEKKYAPQKIKVDVPDKWRYNVKLADNVLTLSPQAMKGVLAQDYPGSGAFGLMKAQSYQRGGTLQDAPKDSPKDQPKDNPELAKTVVGSWLGTDPSTLGRKVEFTAAGKFIQHTEGGKMRDYKVVGANIEMEFTADDRARIPEFLKLPPEKIPTKWVFKAAATESQLKLALEIDPQADRSVQVLAPGGINQTYKRAGADIPKDLPKDPPKDDPFLAKALVGTWKGTTLAVQDKKVMFTADGKFYHSAENNKPRTYRLSGTNVEVDFLAGERDQVEQIAKQLGQNAPDKWVYQAQVIGTKLVLDPKVGLGVGNAIPGGPLKQEYVRDDGPKDPPKDPPKADGIVGKWEMGAGNQKVLVEFTKDRKFTIALGSQSVTRSYSLHNNNTRLDVDLTEQERKQIQNYFLNLKLAKGQPRPTAPNQYHYNIAINGDTLTLDPVDNSHAINQLNVIPGGNNRQTYKRVASP